MTDNALQTAKAYLEKIRKFSDQLELDFDRLEELRDSFALQSSVISGTHRTQDLIPAFINFLSDNCDDISFDSSIPQDAKSNEHHKFWDSPEAAELLAELEDKLNFYAPDYCYFGAHPGDGSDFGFWMIEEYAAELAELEEVAGEYSHVAEVEEAIWELPLSVEVRSGWQTVGEELKPEEFQIMLCTGGPAVRIVGELDQWCEPCRARIEYADWFESWTELPESVDDSAVIAFCQNFVFS